MFERFTEKARRSLFFARYEASTLGAQEVETEHLLLGILREDKSLADSLIAFNLSTTVIRDKITRRRPEPPPQISTTVDLPHSVSLKRAVAYGAEEAERFGLRMIDTEFLLLGLARDHSCFASRILSEAGVTTARLRELATPVSGEHGLPPKPAAQDVAAQDSEGFRDLTQLAASGNLTPFIGREVELRRTAHILSRRTRNSVALIGDPGVGKTALVEGLVQYLNSGAIEHFAEHRVLQVEAASLFPVKPGARPPKLGDDILRDLADRGQTLLAIEGLFDLALARFDWGLTEAWHVLSPYVSTGRLQCIVTGTPAGLQATLAKSPDLARSFEIVLLAAPAPEEAVKILEGLKPGYEQFHGVSFARGTIEMAVYASGRFLPQRSLPDRALDLLDEAAAHVHIRQLAETPEILAARKEVERLARDFRASLDRGEMEQCHALSDLERTAQEKLRVLREQRPAAPVPSVTPDDIEQVAADRLGAPLSAIRAILAKKGPADLDEVLGRLTGRIPIEQTPWLPLLAAYIARASDAEIDALIESIRAARPS